jgi:hypothetical protein
MGGLDMVSNVRGYTPNYKFKLVNFDTPRWHTLEYANWSTVDGLLLQAGIPQIRGDWAYSTVYLVGDRAMDTETNVLYRCLVQHTSAADGTFAQDRASHPTYWTLQTLGVPVFRGVWATATTYAPGDIVVVGAYAYYLCTISHTSSSPYPPGVGGEWTLIFDATAAVNITTQKATEASNSATQAATSAINASNSATAAQASAVESAAQAQKLFGTSTSSVLLGLGAKSFTTQASKYFNVGKFLMVRATSNPVDMWMWGQVASYTGTALVLNSQAFAGSGAFADWIIDVSGIKGADGSGGGVSSITTADVPPPAPRDGDMWWKTDTGVMYVYYDDGDSQQWVQAVAVPSVGSGFVGVDADQGFTELQKAQGRKNIAAAPLDAMAYHGMQINGGFDINQAGVGTSTSQTYICDGWKLLFNGTMASSAASGGPISIAGIPNFGFAQINTAQASLAAGDYAAVSQFVEGWRILRLAFGTANAQPITLCFWSSHVRTGLYTGSIRNGATNRTYAFTYTQAASNVPQYNVITIPGDQAGTWTADANIGMFITFAMATGSTFTAPSANSWLAGNYQAAPGQINAVAATSDIFRITGVVLLPGTQGPTAQQSPLVMRPYDQELLACRRYYQRIGDLVTGTAIAAGFCYSTTLAIIPYKFPVMRASPTITLNAGANWAVSVGAGLFSVTSFSASPPNTQSVRFDVTVASGLTAGYAAALTAQNTSAALILDARL